MPHEELTPRSDSPNSPPLDSADPNRHHNGCSSSNGSTSETSSGVHSNASNASNEVNQRRATSVEELPSKAQLRDPRDPELQWRSSSLQRGTQPPSGHSYNNAQYPALFNGDLLDSASKDSTVVIRRRLSRPKLTDSLGMGEEPFGRSTNMRMTSFTENSDLRAIQPSSATLPHYPTQPAVTYPHCSTMPLPHASSHNSAVASGAVVNGNAGSCSSVPRHTAYPGASGATTTTAHTTLPSHHNGVRLLHGHGAPGNPFVKRFPQIQVQPWPLSGHHTFPQLPPPPPAPSAITAKVLVNAQVRQCDRDSANFSMASSGDSDTCLPH